MMNKLTYIYALLLMMMISSTVSFGQQDQAGIRRTQEEQRVFEKSVPVNPSGIDPQSQVDPRMILPQPDPVNWKPAAIPPDDRILTQVNTTDNNTVAGSVPDVTADQNQPEGARPQGKTINYRELKGDKNQPDAPKPDNVRNYRDLRGSKTQPEGDKPRK